METTDINLNEISFKAKSKGELYRMLVTEGQMYLMPQRECGLAFLSEICLGRKRVFFNDEIKVCQVPHLNGLHVSQILDFIIHKCEAEIYLPNNYYIYPPNRTWLCNIAYTLDSNGFDTLIKTVMNKREEQILKKSNIIIKMNSKIAKIFKNSHNVSVEKGKSHMLLRKAILQDQRAARKNQEKELKDVADLVPELRSEINKLAEELDAKDKKIEEYEKHSGMLAELFEIGVIDEDGNLIKQRNNDNMD